MPFAFAGEDVVAYTSVLLQNELLFFQPVQAGHYAAVVAGFEEGYDVVPVVQPRSHAEEYAYADGAEGAFMELPQKVTCKIDCFHDYLFTKLFTMFASINMPWL